MSTGHIPAVNTTCIVSLTLNIEMNKIIENRHSQADILSKLLHLQSPKDYITSKRDGVGVDKRWFLEGGLYSGGGL